MSMTEPVEREIGALSFPGIIHPGLFPIRKRIEHPRNNTKLPLSKNLTTETHETHETESTDSTPRNKKETRPLYQRTGLKDVNSKFVPSFFLPTSTEPFD